MLRTFLESSPQTLGVTYENIPRQIIDPENGSVIRLVEVLGKGGFSTVYLGVTSENQHVVVKRPFLDRRFNQSEIDREVKFLEILKGRHQNIINFDKVLDRSIIFTEVGISLVDFPKERYWQLLRTVRNGEMDMGSN